jgi:hypothetical protein
VLDNLGVEQGSVPQFGFKARVPLKAVPGRRWRPFVALIPLLNRRNRSHHQ